MNQNIAKTDFKTVDDYIQTFPKDVQTILQRVRQTIHEAVPEAQEVISYQIPAIKYHGWVFYFSAYKKHFFLACPPTTKVFEAFKKELSSYKLSKSTLQCPLDKGVPVKLIRDLQSKRECRKRQTKDKKEITTKRRKQ
jgi:uncharacterized protein YdhG (YjbR/CyaY superfamily)